MKIDKQDSSAKPKQKGPVKIYTPKEKPDYMPSLSENISVMTRQGKRYIGTVTGVTLALVEIPNSVFTFEFKGRLANDVRDEEKSYKCTWFPGTVTYESRWILSSSNSSPASVRTVEKQK